MALNTPQGQVETMVAAGGLHTAGLRCDGTAIAMGYTGDDVGGWTGIIQVAAGGYHTVGLKADDTVVAVGRNLEGQCDVGNWTDITQVAAGGHHTVGVKSDGTVVAVGWNSHGQCDVGNWTGITQVAAGWYHTVGIKSDDTVVAVGDNSYGRCDVGGWTGIVQVSAGNYYTVGLKANASVVATGLNDYGQCDVDGWTGITQVAAGWYHTVGVKSDDTVVAVGRNDYGQCDVSEWNLCGVSPACVETATRTGIACLSANHGAIENLQAVAAPSPLPHGVRLPHGMFTFEITGLTPGQSVTLTAEFPDPIPTHWVWWKYHDGTWSRVPIGRTTNPRIITFTLTDNVPPGDEDSILGQITDQGGPGDPGSVGWETYRINKARVLLPWTALAAAIMAGVILLGIRRRRSRS